MRKPIRSGQFKRDVKVAQKRGKDLSKLRTLLLLLIEAVPLPPEYLDHPLKGQWQGLSGFAYRTGLAANLSR